MTGLNELLKKYIEESNYTIYSLSAKSKVNRTTLQKALSGDRNISNQNLEKIIPFLNLTPMEKNELDTAFMISRFGETACAMIQYIKELLQSPDLMGYPAPEKLIPNFILPPPIGFWREVYL